MLLTAGLALVRWRQVDRRTRAGERLLRREQSRADRLRRAALPHETDQAVALFGTAVLAGSAYAGYHDLRVHLAKITDSIHCELLRRSDLIARPRPSNRH